MEKSPLQKTFSRQVLVYPIGLILLASAIFFLFLGHKPRKPSAPDPAFAAYVSAYTGGVISRDHDIVIKLAQDPSPRPNPGDEAPADLLSFSPSIPGTARWKDARTLVFTPAGPMRSGKSYEGMLKLDKLLKVNSKKLKRFVFGFQVIAQSFEVQAVGLKASGARGLEQYDYQGRVLTADAADSAAVTRIVRASLGGRQLPVSWQRATGNVHPFLVKGIRRGAAATQLHLEWSGKPIGVDMTGQDTVRIPAKGSFVLLSTDVQQGATPAVHLLFSDPLDEQQSVDGLITIDTLREMNATIQGNEVTLYPGKVTPGTREISLYQGIRNIDHKALTADSTFYLKFEDLKPAVRFLGQGNILPSTEGLVLPIEAVNLRSLQVRVIKIFQNRVGSFLQVNDVDGAEQLTRVGRPVLTKMIHLDNMGVDDLGKWNRFTLELSKLIAPDPGAIYQISLAFAKQDAIVPCSATADDGGLEKVADPREQTDASSFDNSDSRYFYDDFGQYYDADYNWRERDNPCNSAYYSGSNNVITRNILATDIGLTAKKGTDGSLLVIATDLKTAEPMAGANIRIYNYQLQQIAMTRTDGDGKALVKTTEKPFLAEASHHNQWAYLKLNDASALSVSQFDVSGSRVQQGIKGFLYGERGVWRPGDSIFLSFMLEDKNHELPEEHPVVFELTNPRGVVVQRKVMTSSVHGLYSFATATDAGAPTGNWSAGVSVGGATFTKVLKIETVKPNRLKVELHFPGDKITPDNQTGKLHVRWLTGASAAHLRAQYEMILSQARTTFPGYGGYQFDDPAQGFSTVDQVIFDGTLDGDGNAEIHPAIELGAHAPASLTAYFTGKIFEPGGNFSVDYQSVKYYPYTRYIGIKIPEGTSYGGMLELGRRYPVSVATVDAAGKPVDMDSLQVKVYKAQWRWWWEQNDQGADFVNSKYYHLVSSQKLSTRGGKGSFVLSVPSPQWGRYYVRVSDSASGFAAGSFVYFEWPSGESSNLTGMPGGATRLNFTAEKQVYKVGETIRLFIPGSGEGNDLISVENGSRVLETFWMKEKKGTNEFTIPVTKDMTPNVYINVSQIQPHAQTVNDLPIRQYGVIGLKIEDPTTMLQPEISLPDKLRPNQKVTIRVKEKTGKPMAYTIAVVDEGLLDLTNYKTPDPHGVFYAREALGVTSWDAFDQVIGAYGARLERLLSIGGDGSVSEQPKSENIRFKPVVEFLGPYYLEAGRSQTRSFTMPNYVGEVRAMIVAGDGGAYGSAEKTVPVSQPLMVLATLPRVAGPGEDISLPVNIFAMEKDVRDITLRVTTDKYFSLAGESTQEVHMDQPGTTLVNFQLKAAQITGAGKIHIEAVSGAHHASADVNLTIRNPNAPESRVLSKALQPGESWSPDIRLFGLPGTNGLDLEVATVPPLNLAKRVGYLIDYPYGCVEQTVSKAFGQLYLDKLVALSKEQQSEVTAHIKTAIHALQGFQHASGGFTYWPGSNYPDDWATSYAGDFLLKARKRGYDVPQSTISAWSSYQRSRANQWKPQKQYQDELMQAYRLYTLAEASDADWSAMNRMRGLQKLSLEARWRLAGAYVAGGKQDVAKALVESAPMTVSPYRSLGYTYGSTTRDEAMILQTLTDMGDHDRGYTLAKNIAGTMSSDEWLSTQETAFCLAALAGYFERSPAAASVEYSYQLGKSTPHRVTSRLAESRQDIPVTSVAPAVTVKNTSSGVQYANFIIRGTPAAGSEQPTQHDLQMHVAYLNAEGKPLDPATLPQGTNLVAQVTVYNPGLRGRYANMALTQIFPSGWEIRNTRMEGTSGFYEASVPDYQDVRDDRVYTYFDLAPGETKTFRVLLSATYQGKFYLPSVKCAAMYDNSIIAVTPESWVRVTGQ